jgi:hypothetical protein
LKAAQPAQFTLVAWDAWSQAGVTAIVVIAALYLAFHLASTSR